MRMVTCVIDSTGSDEERMSNNKNVITHMNKGILHVLFYRKVGVASAERKNEVSFFQHVSILFCSTGQKAGVC